jgi:hypothetical protein
MWTLLTGLFSSYGTAIKIALLVAFVCGVFFAGWHTRDRDFTVYKLEQQAIVEKQQAENESIKKQQALVTKGIQDEYDAKLALIRQYYANGVRQSGTSAMPGISATTKLSDAVAAYNVLAGQCAETTLQVTEWQKWYEEVKKASEK